MRLRDVRCDGYSALGGMCGNLLFKIDPDAKAVIEYLCRRCKTVRTVRFGLVTATT